MQAVIKNEYQVYHFPCNFSITITGVTNNKVVATMKIGANTVGSMELACSVTNKLECRRLAQQFFKLYCFNLGLDASKDYASQEEQYYLVGSNQDCWLIVRAENRGIRVTSPWGEIHSDTSITSTRQVKQLVIDTYRYDKGRNL